MEIFVLLCLYGIITGFTYGIIDYTGVGGDETSKFSSAALWPLMLVVILGFNLFRLVMALAPIKRKSK